MLQEMASLEKLEGYYTVEIQGGEYKDTIKLVDGSIKDNFSVLRNLSQSKVHEEMISSSDSYHTYDIGNYYVILPTISKNICTNAIFKIPKASTNCENKPIPTIFQLMSFLFALKI